MEIAHKPLSPLASRMVSWCCGILQRFWWAQGMLWPILLISPHQHVCRLQHFSIADFAKYNTYRSGSRAGFQPYSNQFACFWWYYSNGEVRVDICQFPINLCFFSSSTGWKDSSKPYLPVQEAKNWTKLHLLPGIGRFSMYSLVPALQYRLYCHLGFTVAYKENGKLLLWRTAVAQELERSSWLVRLFLRWPLEDSEACQ